MRRLAPLLLCAALALPGASAHAFLSDTEARKQVIDLKAELARSIDTLRQRVDGMGKNQLDFANQVEALRADVARITGQIEVLTNSLDAAHKRQQDFYVDLDNRLRKIENTAASKESAAAVEPQADPQAEMRDYEAALGLFRERKFKEAQAAFETFVAAHPKSALLPNGHYWLGSSLYQQKGFLQAAAAFGKVAADWPKDPRAPEALLQQADALVKAKDVPGAINVLTALAAQYPSSPEAATARTRLKTLAPQRKR